MKTLPGTGALVRSFLRTFTIQGSWNYHTMIGCGFAFALLPILRRLHAGEPQALAEAARRHAAHFNAHPYLAGLAVGAVARLEAEGEAPETIERLKTALRGPLGGLGDALLWATWLPLASLLGLAMLWAGASGALAAAAFLILYNLGHVAVRGWAYVAGIRRGRGVARSRGLAAIGRVTGRLQTVAALVLGVAAGLAVAAPAGPAASHPLWAGVAALAFVVGSVAGRRAWRPTAYLTVGVVGLVLLAGMTG